MNHITPLHEPLIRPIRARSRHTGATKPGDHCQVTEKPIPLFQDFA